MEAPQANLGLKPERLVDHWLTRQKLLTLVLFLMRIILWQRALQFPEARRRELAHFTFYTGARFLGFFRPHLTVFLRLLAIVFR